jgi:hypothetical protein
VEGGWGRLSCCYCSAVVCFGGVGGVSDMAGYGVRRLHTSRVSHYLGLPVSLSAFLSLSNTLTSCLDGEEGGSVVVRSSLRMGCFASAPVVGSGSYLKK